MGSKLTMWAEDMVKILPTAREILCFPKYGLGKKFKMRVVTSGVAWYPLSHKKWDESGDLCRGMVSRKSQKLIEKLDAWVASKV